MLADNVTIVKDVILSCAALVAAYVGCRGLNTWRRQLHGDIEYQAARNTLTTVYELRDAICYVRNPLMSLHREASIPAETPTNLSPDKKLWNAKIQEFERRWEPVQKAITRLDTSKLELETLWGEKIRNKLSSLKGLTVELLGCVEDYLEDDRPNNNQRLEKESLNRLRRIVYRTQKDDEFEGRIQKAIREIEDELRPHIAQKRW